MLLLSGNRYHKLLELYEEAGLLLRPKVPIQCQHNAHMYYVLLPLNIGRQKVLEELRKQGVSAVSHYIPLHNSYAGLKYGRVHGELKVTERHAAQLIRLPLWVGLTSKQQKYAVSALIKAIKTNL